MDLTCFLVVVSWSNSMYKCARRNIPSAALTISFCTKLCSSLSRITHFGSRWIWFVMKCFTSLSVARMCSLSVCSNSSSISGIKREVIIIFILPSF
ncbi:uncharacterized protein BDW43DRAFT_264789 [Aspergillus alliaceus]|uniref:uncharacterized protein n=1 Tax=Petromyces alliaceus TaxID=209559 RepID=UPI0012A6EF49|nr:uncharacterized protein BDW43DRAFT_264789 [Aspergillus alliaceus]KAB8237169.1 hypothetical protein BDW43DRAFT_264789 [Aspergillus alliaceus]